MLFATVSVSQVLIAKRSESTSEAWKCSMNTALPFDVHNKASTSYKHTLDRLFLAGLSPSQILICKLMLDICILFMWYIPPNLGFLLCRRWCF
ncbi:hypothetical protein BVRB_1g011060 [Beta vulgaris subsp. vulgaris]|nr:hypothetical protein BVRB_1g011060 [Beta vulgaris subsp. vulgaris]